jgi:hypothetical protein
MKKFSILIYLLLFMSVTTIIYAQVPNLQAEKSFGGSENEFAFNIHQTSDGGYIIAGQAASNNGNVTGNHGDEDMWIVKLNKNGSIKWQKALGGIEDESAFSIQETRDGGFIVAGEASFSSGQVTGNHGTLDFWIVKLDSSGELDMAKIFRRQQKRFCKQYTTNNRRRLCCCRRFFL